MGILDKLFGKKKEKVRASKKVDVVESAIARVSNASDEKRVEIAMELLKHPNYEIRAAVASVTARLGIKAVGVWFELANRLGDDYEKVRLEAAKAFWQLEGVGYAIRSLRDEFDAPAHISKEEALRGIDALRLVSPDQTTFEKLLEENWEDCPRIVKDIDKGEKVEHEEKVTHKITCASCKKRFTWNEAYFQQDTPGSTPYHPPGHGDGRPRVFCPYCGALVVDWHITREKDFNEWIWYGDNATLNAECSLPPSPWSYGWGQGIPIDFKLNYADTKEKIDVEKIKQFNAEREASRQKAIEEENESKEEERIDWAKIEDYCFFGNTLWAKGDYKGAEKAFRLSIKIDPKLMGAYNALGILLKSQERYDESIETFNKAMKVDLYNIMAYKHLAYLLIDLKRFEEADDVYMKTMAIAPNHPFTRGIKRRLDEKKGIGK